ncbi:hypothetical protein [Yoonia sp.]|uniref:hypothetical protein n=1 Tax=Yoonia sp. TaxID=2212373 RepID=UPI00358FF132
MRYRAQQVRQGGEDCFSGALYFFQLARVAMHFLHSGIVIVIIVQMQQFGLSGAQENSHGPFSSSDRDGFERRHISSLVVPPLSIFSK